MDTNISVCMYVCMYYVEDQAETEAMTPRPRRERFTILFMPQERDLKSQLFRPKLVILWNYCIHVICHCFVFVLTQHSPRYTDLIDLPRTL